MRINSATTTASATVVDLPQVSGERVESDKANGKRFRNANESRTKGSAKPLACPQSSLRTAQNNAMADAACQSI
jgi:hypothetical protein